MITAVDTNILLDVFLPDKRFAPDSAELLKLAYDEGALIICDIVCAELVPQFEDRQRLDDTLATINVSLSSVDADVAFLAGEKWGLYRKSRGKRQRIITDFLIGAQPRLQRNVFLLATGDSTNHIFPNVKSYPFRPRKGIDHEDEIL